jgi:hypothetical protein
MRELGIFRDGELVRQIYFPSATTAVFAWKRSDEKVDSFAMVKSFFLDVVQLYSNTRRERLR